jgi:hypothetical protein
MGFVCTQDGKRTVCSCVTRTTLSNGGDRQMITNCGYIRMLTEKTWIVLKQAVQFKNSPGRTERNNGASTKKNNGKVTYERKVSVERYY